MSQPKITLIAGPTASGKSALALDLSRKNNGIIINADALQVYKALPILSAQPKDTDFKETPHRLYGTVSPTEKSSAGTWLIEAKKAADEALALGCTPILVGGTGLYFKAFQGGLADIPPIPDDLRHTTEELYKKWGEEKFRKELASLDPLSATQIKHHDRQRLLRAYEVALHTGHPLSYWHAQDKSIKKSPYDFTSHLLMPDREALYAACDARFERMLKEGALDEVRDFLKLDLDPTLPVMKTIGVRELSAYLKNEMTLEDATKKAQQMTRNYAKRQMTWFRNQWSSQESLL